MGRDHTIFYDFVAKYWGLNPWYGGWGGINCYEIAYPGESASKSLVWWMGRDQTITLIKKMKAFESKSLVWWMARDQKCEMLSMRTLSLNPWYFEWGGIL